MEKVFEVTLKQMILIIHKAINSVDIRLFNHGEQVAYIMMNLLKADGNYSDEEINKVINSNYMVEVNDKVETYNALSEGLDTVEQLIERIEKIFSDESQPGVNFSTIHRAKGLEANNIFLLFHVRKMYLYFFKYRFGKYWSCC